MHPYRSRIDRSWHVRDPWGPEQRPRILLNYVFFTIGLCHSGLEYVGLEFQLGRDYLRSFGGSTCWPGLFDLVVKWMSLSDVRPKSEDI